MSPLTEQSVLWELARRAREQSYSPYSRFAVGAAVETRQGQLFSGCNIENAAYGCCICAEQVAIAKAVSEGHRQLRQILVVGTPLAPPCGQCRQVISEFFDESGLIHACDAADRQIQRVWTLADLLPDRFRLRHDAD